MFNKSHCLFTLLLFVLNIGYSQIGEFIYQNFPANYYLNLLPNNEFEYDEIWGTVQIIGKGTYLINQDSLYLEFEKFEIPNQQTAIKKVNNSDRKLTLMINAIDFETKKELENLYLFYVDNYETNSETIEVKNGKVVIKGVDFPVAIKIWAEDYSTSFLNIEEFGNYEVETSHQSGVIIENYKVKTGVHKYKIDKLGVDKFSIYLLSQKFTSEFK
jgi:hypothetical protein